MSKLDYLFPDTARAIQLVKDFKQLDINLTNMLAEAGENASPVNSPLFRNIEPWLWDRVMAIFFLELNALLLKSIK